MNNTILVSVEMITYKHEDYIKQAVEGVLMQETNFDYELIISDDCSPDATEQIVKQIISNHPKGNLIKYFRHEKNIGVQKNGMFSLNQGKAKYIAVCEGDDYWTDPLKLQKQVSFLENNPDYSMVCHNAKIIYENTNRKPQNFSDRKIDGDISMKQILTQWIIPTASMVFRRNCINPLPLWFGEIYSGDFTLALLNRHCGNIFFINDFMSVYRVNFVGTSMSATIGKNMTFVLDEHTKLLNYFNLETKNLYSNIINAKIASIYKEKAFIKARQKGLISAFLSMPFLFMEKFMEKFIRIINKVK